MKLNQTFISRLAGLLCTTRVERNPTCVFMPAQNFYENLNLTTEVTFSTEGSELASNRTCSLDSDFVLEFLYSSVRSDSKVFSCVRASKSGASCSKGGGPVL